MNKVRKRGLLIFIGSFLALHGAACGPMTYTRERIEFEPYSASEAKQSRSGLTIERQNVTDIPAEFRALAPRCNRLNGQLMVDFQGRPQREQVSLVPSGTVIEKLQITNKTGHIVRLNSAVIAMFDPADNQYDALDRDQIAAMLVTEHPCANASGFVQSLKLVKLIDRNKDVLPNRTETGYLVFNPAQRNMSGIWKVSLYEVPTKTNAAGGVTETVQFDFRTEAKRYRDTFRKESPIAEPVRIKTEPLD